jgi:Rhodanese-like domain
MTLAFRIHKPIDALTFLSWLLVLFQLPTGTRAQEEITAQRFYELSTTGQVDLIVDVRTQEEWDTGHIPNATLVANFGGLLSNTPAEEINATLQSLGLFTCLHCTTIGT